MFSGSRNAPIALGEWIIITARVVVLQAGFAKPLSNAIVTTHRVNDVV
jgi:hypothetical protein